MDYLNFIPIRLSELRVQKGVSAREMSISLGQSESYINKIENNRTLPSMFGFLYICEYLEITPEEFFHHQSQSPHKTKELLADLEKLTPTQQEHIHQIILDIAQK